ncbi:MAG: ubiquitin family protein [Candidatus Krumholzibacteriia bacterium]
MTRRALLATLAAGRVAVLTLGAWERLAAGFAVLEDHDTRLAGRLLVVEGPAGLAAVEAPRPDERVVPPLKSRRAAREFVAARLRAYERMWDG